MLFGCTAHRHRIYSVRLGESLRTLHRHHFLAPQPGRYTMPQSERCNGDALEALMCVLCAVVLFGQDTHHHPYHSICLGELLHALHSQ